MLHERDDQDGVALLTSGDEICARLTRTINSRTGGHVRDLQVSMTQAGVVLTGTAHTYYAKQLATHAAFDEFRGLHVENDIDVS